jgi:glycosyltransferase involved in cell wall biosynthesis
MPHPAVSIIIPCHNAAPWIADAILSALSQTYSSVEVVVFDDGSTDGSREIIRSFGERIKSKFIDHHGAAHARNRGLQMASGEFIQFLDADDSLFPHCAKRKVEAILTEEADVVYSGGFFFNVHINAGNYEPQAAPGKDHAAAVAQVIASTIVTTLVMCRKASLESVGGFDENLANGQEHDLLLRLAIKGCKFAYVPEALSLNRTGHNPRSITCVTSQDPYHLEMLFSRFRDRLKNTKLWTPEVRGVLAWRFHYVGVKYLAVGNKTRAIMMFHMAKELHRKYRSRLPFSRRCLVPLVGEYLAERFLNKIRSLLPRSYISF